MLPFRLVFPVLPALLATSLLAQQLPPGYADQVVALPAGASPVQRLTNGATCWFDGLDLWVAAPGQSPVSRLQFATYTFGSFLLELPGGDVLFGESSQHGMWVIPAQGSAPAAPVATVPYNYDAAQLSPTTVVISARTGGFGASTNDVIVLEPATGNTQLLASLPGASGPLAVAANGDVYYATATPLYPPPAGQATVLRFPRPVVDQALATSTVLGIASAQVVFAGLDAAGDLAFDDDGDLFFTDWFGGALRELNDATGPSPWLTTLVDYATAPFNCSALQFVPGGPASSVLEPFQPAHGTLLIQESAWNGPNQHRAVTAAPAALAVPTNQPIPHGPFACTLTGGAPGGLALLALGLGGPTGPTALAVPGVEAALAWDTTSAGGFVVAVATLDGSGGVTFALSNPGPGVPLTLTAEVAFLAPAQGWLGSSGPRTLLLQP